MAKLCTALFTSNGTWTAPAGVTKVLLIGQGGGAGGSGGRNTTSWYSTGGNGTVPYLVEISVVPNTTYTITIGTGGAGGVANSSVKNGGVGGNTTFGSLYTFYGAPNGWSGSTNKAYVVLSPGNIFSSGTASNGFDPSTASSGYINTTSTSTNSGSFRGGLAGAPGWLGGAGGGAGGGQGGNANSSGTGGTGSSGSGRGAGGGGGGAGSASGGAGGNGVAGQLQIAWIE